MIEKQHNAFENLHIMTNQGVVVKSENQVIEVGKELDFMDIFISHNTVDAPSSAPQTTTAFLGPAFISNFENFQHDAASDISGVALAPTLLGAIAEGIALTSID